jgi:hypothetical protein
MEEEDVIVMTPSNQSFIDLQDKLKRFPVKWIFTMCFMANFQTEISKIKDKEPRRGFVNELANIITRDFMQCTQYCTTILKRMKFPHRPQWEIQVNNAALITAQRRWREIDIITFGSTYMPKYLPVNRYIPMEMTDLIYQEYQADPWKYTTCHDYAKSVLQ